ncbi:MAG TPA: sigma-70 family RNA polymerase sigma factor [Xanthobacteraceae bacterium]|nr:sigma-70 family RNA polymerase sigma factor [Xanthobacteraceae bacterium]
MEQTLAVSGAKPGWQPSITIRTDETLIGLIAAHDRNAMRKLFVRHSARVFRFLRRAVTDATAAEDLLNEVFIDIWRHAGRFEGRSKVSTWILAIAHFKAAAWRRRRACDRLDDGAVEAIEDLADDPEVAAQKQRSSVVIRECLKRLSPAHRTILDLIYYHEQSIAEVARIVGVPENTVKTRAYYARKCLEQLLAERGIGRDAL